MTIDTPIGERMPRGLKWRTLHHADATSRTPIVDIYDAHCRPLYIFSLDAYLSLVKFVKRVRVQFAVQFG